MVAIFWFLNVNISAFYWFEIFANYLQFSYTKLSMFGLAPSATEEGAKCPQKAPPSPPQELKSTIHHKINTPIDFKDYK